MVTKEEYGSHGGELGAESSARHPQRPSAQRRKPHSHNALVKLAPGMVVQAEINQGTRTVLEYLLSPVQKVAGEAGRER